MAAAIPLLIFSVISILWVLYGYSLAFTANGSAALLSGSGAGAYANSLADLDATAAAKLNAANVRATISSRTASGSAYAPAYATTGSVTVSVTGHTGI